MKLLVLVLFLLAPLPAQITLLPSGCLIPFPFRATEMHLGKVHVNWGGDGIVNGGVTVMAIGLHDPNIHLYNGCFLRAYPLWTLSFTGPGFTNQWLVPNDPNLVGMKIYLQVARFDVAGAAIGVSDGYRIKVQR